MATISEIYRHLNTVLPISLSCDWDNDGLMVCAHSGTEVKKIRLFLAWQITNAKILKHSLCLLQTYLIRAIDTLIEEDRSSGVFRQLWWLTHQCSAINYSK